MEREIELPTGYAKIKASRTGVSISVDGGFSGTGAQLKTLNMTLNGFSQKEVAANLGTTTSTVKQHIYASKKRNINSDMSLPDIRLVASYADMHELLYPITIIGLETFGDKMRTESREKTQSNDAESSEA
jgi:DNA-binding CsgD family transcriptional regulator